MSTMTMPACSYDKLHHDNKHNLNLNLNLNLSVRPRPPRPLPSPRHSHGNHYHYHQHHHRRLSEVQQDAGSSSRKTTSPAAAAATPQAQSHMLDLPANVRMQILRHVLLSPYTDASAVGRTASSSPSSAPAASHHGTDMSLQRTTAGLASLPIHSRALVAHMRQTGQPFHHPPFFGTEAMTRLFRVCRKMYCEASYIVYSECVVDFPHYNTSGLVWEWAGGLCARSRMLVQHVGDLILLYPGAAASASASSASASSASSSSFLTCPTPSFISSSSSPPDSLPKPPGPPLFTLDHDKQSAWSLLAALLPNVRSFTLQIALVHNAEEMHILNDPAASQWFASSSSSLSGGDGIGGAGPGGSPGGGPGGGCPQLVDSVMHILSGAFKRLETVVFEYARVGPWDYQGERWRMAEVRVVRPGPGPGPGLGGEAAGM